MGPCLQDVRHVVVEVVLVRRVREVDGAVGRNVDAVGQRKLEALRRVRQKLHRPVRAHLQQTLSRASDSTNEFCSRIRAQFRRMKHSSG